jgi:hypothetical protein
MRFSRLDSLKQRLHTLLDRRRFPRPRAVVAERILVLRLTDNDFR